MNINFKFPNTTFCLVVWYRPKKGTAKPVKRKEIRMATPPNPTAFQMELLKHKVGVSEVRAVKADLSSPVKDVSGLNPFTIQNAMTRLA